MAETVHVAGACQIKIAFASYASGALQTLGYTRNQADSRKEAYFLNVPGDQNGGDDGPPIEIIYLGETATIRLELTKYDDTIANLIRARVDAEVAGTPGTPGTLMFSGNKTARVLLNSANDPRNFPSCIPRMPIEIGRGTKYSSLIVEFEAHKNSSGVLYNAVTS